MVVKLTKVECVGNVEFIKASKCRIRQVGRYDSLLTVEIEFLKVHKKVNVNGTCS